jgi:hypothetical protein
VHRTGSHWLPSAWWIYSKHFGLKSLQCRIARVGNRSPLSLRALLRQRVSDILMLHGYIAALLWRLLRRLSVGHGHHRGYFAAPRPRRGYFAAPRPVQGLLRRPGPAHLLQSNLSFRWLRTRRFVLYGTLLLGFVFGMEILCGLGGLGSFRDLHMIHSLASHFNHDELALPNSAGWQPESPVTKSSAQAAGIRDTEASCMY